MEKRFLDSGRQCGRLNMVREDTTREG
ncbi:hypothetical protein Godav_013743 [Gossypium davidsonii]|uniref:Uncharacterized protein n=2 Tax=Gossypium TaxID=3633 RepID=A0A7J8RHS6_GOSDV|nr:hypothetical protein [Gossypium davidsonii]MBA0648476.1 hypothetical protein [Gossypium klotzschianum]